MFDEAIKKIIGDPEENKAYKQFMKRVKILPEEYRYAFRKIQNYIYCVGSADVDMNMFTDLVELFETSAAEGRRVLDVIGDDVAQFSDEFMRVSLAGRDTQQERLNREIKEKFNREGR